VAALVVASHPLPTLAVTAFAVGYGVSRGLAHDAVLRLAAAVLTGQMSVGWLNDWRDADRDRAAGRGDKPVAVRAVAASTVGWAALVAATACIPLSFLLGTAAGLLHLLAVASAWAYDLLLKSGPLSPLPYLVSFALLPVVVASTAGRAVWPGAGAVAGAGLLGAAAHFANTVGDSESDAATGVRGLPQRLGPDRSLRVVAGLVVAAALVLFAASGHRGVGASFLLAAGAVVAALGPPIGQGRGRRTAFRVTVVGVALVVAGFLAAT
jgi:4-hydroxybenzoate polyprenyltransferase